jgi:[FeFe] hydrogenase H-cluster maturation GTPase HydF
MPTAPKSLRLHIGLFGRRNAGKSSLLNALTRQDVSIVSEIAGTTTDPVEKPMELLPLGPVLFIDTAGVDDEGALGDKRVKKTRQVFDRTDVGVLVVDAGRWGEFEDDILGELRDRNIPVVVAFNKSDLALPLAASQDRLQEANIPFVETVASHSRGILDLREALIQAAPDEFLRPPALVADLVPPGEMAVLVIPIDTEAPKGRLIVPQVQTIRDLLDGDAYCMVVKERELRDALGRLNRPPALVVTDSQAFLKVSADTPPDVKMTSFSILFARQKGDLCQFVEGALAIERLRPGDRVLIAESCAHHPIGDDIGRVKIPRWLTQYVGGELRIDTVQGHDFPSCGAGVPPAGAAGTAAPQLRDYKLVVHCGACMWNRREMLTRMAACRRVGVPICNYGMTIAYTLGIFDRALAPFPDAMETYSDLKGRP